MDKDPLGYWRVTSMKWKFERLYSTKMGTYFNKQPRWHDYSQVSRNTTVACICLGNVAILRLLRQLQLVHNCYRFGYAEHPHWLCFLLFVCSYLDYYLKFHLAPNNACGVCWGFGFLLLSSKLSKFGIKCPAEAWEPIDLSFETHCYVLVHCNTVYLPPKSSLEYLQQRFLALLLPLENWIICEHVERWKSRDALQTDHAIGLRPGTELPFMRTYSLSPERSRKPSRRPPKGIDKPRAPILFSPKKDSELRLCVNYRGLNAITVKIVTHFFSLVNYLTASMEQKFPAISI